MRSKVRLAAALLGGLSLAALGYGSALAAHGMGGGDVREGGHAMVGGAGHVEHGSRGERFEGREHFAGRERFEGREHFAERGHSDHFHRHRVFRNGVWVWVTGPDYYAYGGCGWLLRRAEITGSPYWWHRYNLCEYGY